MNEQNLILARIAEALEGIEDQLETINKEGVVIFMGTDHLEN